MTIARSLLKFGLVAAVLAGVTPAVAQGNAGAKPLTPIRIGLQWLRNGQYAALMLADAKGYFADEGLSVSFINGGPGKNPVPTVAAGQAEFGVVRGPDVFLSHVASSPIDIVALGAITQKDPTVFLTLTDKGAPAPTPADFAGKRVGIQPGTDITLNGVTKKNHIDLSKIKVVSVQATAEPLLVGQVDFYLAQISNQVYQVEDVLKRADAPANLKGKTWQGVMVYDYGVPNYNDVLFATGKTVTDKPELAAQVTRAVARGVQFMVEHPAEAVPLVAHYPEQIEDEAKLTWRFAIQSKLAVSADTQASGYLWMDPKRWSDSMALFKDMTEVDHVVPPEDLMTNKFNPGIKSAAQ